MSHQPTTTTTSADAAESERTPLISSGADEKSQQPLNNRKGNDDADCETEESFLSPEEIARNTRAKISLVVAIGFCFLFMLTEGLFGIVAHSLALLTDAAHMLTDVASLSLALFAVYASSWNKSEIYTFGFKRAEVVGALFSIMLVWALVGVISVEAVERLITTCKCASHSEGRYTECEKTDPKIMLIIGGCGLISNFMIGGIIMWGGAEVQHAHSHGDGEDHGHSHGGGGGGGGGGCSSHGHSHGGGHGHSSGHDANPSPRVKCCTPSVHELACEKEEHGHDHLKKNSGGIGSGVDKGANRSGDLNDSLAVCTAPTSSANIQESSSHGHSHGSHGHSHGSHGHSHGAGAATATSGGGEKKDHDDDDDEVADQTNMNIRGAFLHALGDCLNSIGVMIAAGVIWAGTGVEGNGRSYYNIADPACSLVFAVITLWTTKGLFIDVFGILMERSPKGMHTSCIKRKLEHLPDVDKVNELFVWSISNERMSIAAKLVVRWDCDADELFALLDDARTMATDLGFATAFFEIERGGEVVKLERRPRAAAVEVVPISREDVDVCYSPNAALDDGGDAAAAAAAVAAAEPGPRPVADAEE